MLLGLSRIDYLDAGTMSDLRSSATNPDAGQLRTSDHFRMKSQKMCFQTMVEYEFSLANGAHVSLEASMSGNMIVEVRAMGVVFPARLTLVLPYFQMHAFHVLFHVVSGRKRIRALRTDKKPDAIFGNAATPRALPLRNHRSKIGTHMHGQSVCRVCDMSTLLLITVVI